MNILNLNPDKIELVITPQTTDLEIGFFQELWVSEREKLKIIEWRYIGKKVV